MERTAVGPSLTLHPSAHPPFLFIFLLREFVDLVGCLAWVHKGEDGHVSAQHIAGSHLACLLNKEQRYLRMMLGRGCKLEVAAADNCNAIREEFCTRLYAQ